LHTCNIVVLIPEICCVALQRMPGLVACVRQMGARDRTVSAITMVTVSTWCVSAPRDGRQTTVANQSAHTTAMVGTYLDYYNETF